MKHQWSDGIFKFVANNYLFMTDEAIAEQLTPLTDFFWTKLDIFKIRKHLGLTKKDLLPKRKKKPIVKKTLKGKKGRKKKRR